MMYKMDGVGIAYAIITGVLVSIANILYYTFRAGERWNKVNTRLDYIEKRIDRMEDSINTRLTRIENKLMGVNRGN